MDLTRLISLSSSSIVGYNAAASKGSMTLIRDPGRAKGG
jgi:hypothetical protein